MARSLKIGSVVCNNHVVALMARDMIQLISGGTQTIQEEHGFGGWVLTKEFIAQVVQWTNDAVFEEGREDLLTVLQRKEIITKNSVWHMADDNDYVTLNHCFVSAFADAFIMKSKHIEVMWIEEEEHDLLDVCNRHD